MGFEIPTDRYRYIPLEIDIPFELYCAKVQRNGLVQAFLPKSYALPAEARFLIKKEWLNSVPAEKEYFKVPKKEALVGFKIVEDVKITKYNAWDDVLEILILPLIKPTKVKYKLAVRSYYGKSTGMGAYRGASAINAESIFSATSSSSTGKHWKTYEFYLVPRDQKLIFHFVHVSNRGNFHEWFEDEDGCRIERFQKEVLKTFEHGKIIKVFDLLENKEYEAVELYLHRARKTSASTSYRVLKGELQLVKSDYHELKTHWTELHRITKKPLEIEITRETNSGNVIRYTVRWE